MAGTIFVSALLLVAVRRSWSRVPTGAAIGVTTSLGTAEIDARVPVGATARASSRIDTSRGTTDRVGTTPGGPAGGSIDEPDAVPCPG